MCSRGALGTMPAVASAALRATCGSTLVWVRASWYASYLDRRRPGPAAPPQRLLGCHAQGHTGPSPVLVSLAVLLMGGWAWIAAVHARRRPAAALAIGCLALVLVACLAARDVPTLLRDYSMDTLRVVTRLERSHPETTPAVPRRALRSPAAGHPGPGRS